MGYYTEATNIYSNEYIVMRESDDTIEYIDGIRVVTKPAIVIINGEAIKFNFNNYTLYYYNKMLATESKDYLSTQDNKKIETEKSGVKSPYDKIKIKINYGDGATETLIKPLTHKKYMLTGDNDWSSVEHFYNFNDEKYFNGIQYIIFNIKNLEGLEDKIIIPFTILTSVAANYNIKMDLISANLTNDNDVSFVFNIVGDNQIVFATDKKKS